MSKVRVFAIAVVALLALGGLNASGASAKFRAETSTGKFTATQENTNKFSFTFGAFECTTANYTGNITSTEAESVELTPSYSGCKAAGLGATIHTNGCTFTLTTDVAGTIHITCPVGKEITITMPSAGTVKCTVHIPAQTVTGATYTNIGTGTTREMIMHLEGITNITYSQTAGTGAGACTSSHDTNGSLIGTQRVTGENAAGTAHVGIWKE